MFVIGVNSLDSLEIRQSPNNDRFFYFYDRTRRELVKSFVLKVKPQTRIECQVTLIRQENGRFSPRLEATIRDSTTQAVATTAEPIVDGETRTVRARVDLGECSDEFWQLIRFLERFGEIEIPSSVFSVVSAADASLVDSIRGTSKEELVEALRVGLGAGLDERDIALITDRKAALARFERLMNNSEYFNVERLAQGPHTKPEDVWQKFFEDNPWIFGYGLRLVSCEGLEDSKLQAIVAGNDVFSGSGKRIDALMKTRGRVSGLLFCEIKRPDADLLLSTEYRPGVYSPAEDLRGGVAQVQKTIHKVVLQVTENHRELANTSGEPTGEVVTFVQPQGVLVVGRLSEFATASDGINYEKFASFELLRNSLHGLDVVTFDELYERACFIVENALGESAQD